MKQLNNSKLLYTVQAQNPNHFQAEALMEKKKLKCSSNFKLLCTRKNAFKLLDT